MVSINSLDTNDIIVQKFKTEVIENYINIGDKRLMMSDLIEFSLINEQIEAFENVIAIHNYHNSFELIYVRIHMEDMMHIRELMTHHNRKRRRYYWICN